MDKGGNIRGGAFFNLFDWNKKSRRKLFADGAASQEEAKQGVLPEIELRLNDGVDDVDARGGESVSSSSDHDSGPSVTADNRSGMKAPGVVARLMGLDFLPTSDTGEPCTPLVEAQCVQGCCYQKGSLDCEFSTQINGATCGNELCSCKPLDTKRQKMPSSPIERFQMETLPRKSVKSLPVTHQKLLSPVKNPHFVSSGNAADIMEAAAKILDTRSQGNSSTRFLSSASSCRSLRVCDKPELSAAPRRPSRLLESSLMGLNGMERLGKICNGSEDGSKFKSSPVCNGSNSVCIKGKGKSKSLALQTKGNFQVKAGSSVGQNGTASNQTPKRQLNFQKNKVDRKSSVNSSIVLKQNNQKQNTLGHKDMLPGKLGGARQLHEKSIPRASVSVKRKPTNKLPATSTTHSGKECQIVDGFVKDASTSQTISYTRQKKLVDRVKPCENKELCDTTLVSKNEKRIQHNVIVDEKPMQSEDRRRDSTDVVSFTFRSPVFKSTPATLCPAKTMGKEEDGSYSASDSFQKGHIIGTNGRASTVDLKVINGDALSHLLEQKLRELTSELESSHDNFVITEMDARSTSQDSLDAPETTALMTEFAQGFTPGVDEDFFGPLSNHGSPSVDFHDWNPGQNEEEAKRMTKCSSSGVSKPDPLEPSPSCTLEASFSNESHESSVSCLSSNGMRLDSCIQIELHAGPVLLEDKPSVEAEMETNSASLSFVQTVDEESEDGTSCCRQNDLKLHEQEINYVREVLSAGELQGKDLMLGCDVEGLDPVIFYHLEHKRSNFPDDGNKGVARLNRKVLFDCVSELFSLIFTHHLRAGFRSWSWTKGKALLQGELAEKIYKEISMWRRIREEMVDELVEKDMSNCYSGRWVDFETDVFETGLEIEEEILSTLVDEIIAEFLV